MDDPSVIVQGPLTDPARAAEMAIFTSQAFVGLLLFIGLLYWWGTKE